MIESELINLIADAQSICVLTGAGISQESGVPTFRDSDGLWANLRPDELASIDGFLKNPQLVWEWYQCRRRIIGDVKPNPGHFSLVTIESMVPMFTLVTQNVDNLHRRAGSQKVLELHGNIERNICSKCRRAMPEDEISSDQLSYCKKNGCQGMVRPDVVWFGELLPENELRQATAAAQTCDLFLSIGTSAVVYPAAGLPILAKQSGAAVVEVNRERTDVTAIADYSFQIASGEFLPKLVEAVWPNQVM